MDGYKIFDAQGHSPQSFATDPQQSQVTNEEEHETDKLTPAADKTTIHTGTLLLRGKLISIPQRREGWSIKQLVNELPHIVPPESPILCSPCKRITLDKLVKSKKKVDRDADARTSHVFGPRELRIAIDWINPFESLGTCPMCRLLACDKIWRSGKSPWTLSNEEKPEFLQIQLGLSPSGDSVSLWLPKQAGMEQDEGEIEIFVLHDSPAAQIISGRPWNGFTSESTIKTISEWIESCELKHTSCKKRLIGENAGPEHQLPTRVLYVGTTKKPELRLVETSNQRGRYLALSHCWGAILEIQTRTKCLQAHLQRIDEEKLSPLLQDAVTITRMLDHRYIWIDSLCIVQDDADDWEREAKSMGAVYENALLTIAATGGYDGNYSMLNKAHDVLTDDYVVKLPCHPPETCTGSMFFRPKKLRIDAFCITSSPLNRRAWVTQERILSRRILHFAAGMIYWECDYDFSAANGTSVETWLPAPLRIQLLTVNIDGDIDDGSFGEPELGPISQNKEEFWPMYNRLINVWFDIVRHYNSCALTRMSDKLLAIEGLARSAQARTGLTYHCGLFFDDAETIPRCLLWMPLHGDPLHYVGEAPTWSWAAYDGEVEMWDAESNMGHDPSWSSATRANFAAEILRLIPADSSAPEADPTRLGAIIMAGRPKLARRTPSQDFGRKNAFADAETIRVPLHEWLGLLNCNEHSFAILDDPRPSATGEGQMYKGWVCFDEAGEEHEQFCCLPIIRTERSVAGDRNTAGKQTTYVVWRILAVVRIMGKGGSSDLTFQRVGYGEVFGERWFDKRGKTKFAFV